MYAGGEVGEGVVAESAMVNKTARKTRRARARRVGSILANAWRHPGQGGCDQRTQQVPQKWDEVSATKKRSSIDETYCSIRRYPATVAKRDGSKTCPENEAGACHGPSMMIWFFMAPN